MKETRTENRTSKSTLRLNFIFICMTQLVLVTVLAEAAAWAAKRWLGITPDIPVEVDDDTYLKIYSNALEKSEDAQLQAAIAALTQGNP